MARCVHRAYIEKTDSFEKKRGFCFYSPTFWANKDRCLVTCGFCWVSIAEGSTICEIMQVFYDWHRRYPQRQCFVEHSVLLGYSMGYSPLNLRQPHGYKAEGEMEERTLLLPCALRVPSLLLAGGASPPRKWGETGPAEIIRRSRQKGPGLLRGQPGPRTKKWCRSRLVALRTIADPTTSDLGWCALGSDWGSGFCLRSLGERKEKIKGSKYRTYTANKKWCKVTTALFNGTPPSTRK